jgi:hypothetical protein
MVDKVVSRVVQDTLADHAKALAWRPAEHHIDFSAANLGMLPDVATVDVGHAPTNRHAIGRVEFVNCAVDRVVLDRCHYVEAGLLEAEAHASRSREQIDADQFRFTHHLSNNIGTAPLPANN